MRAESAPDALADALKRLDLRLARVAMEACALTAWLHDGLSQAGWGDRHRDAPGRPVGLRGPHGPAPVGLRGPHGPAGCSDEDHAEHDRSPRCPSSTAGCGVPAAPHRGADHADRLVSPGARRGPSVALLGVRFWWPGAVCSTRCAARMAISENVARAISREEGVERGTARRQDFAARMREMAGGEPGLMAR